jgi:tetratricopeptide (TPR) repeat protein
MAVNTGVSTESDGQYFGQATKRAADLLAAAHGDQVLISKVTADLSRERLPVAVALRNLGIHHLKGFDRAEEVFQLDVDGQAIDFGELRSEVGLFDVFVSYRRTDTDTVRSLVDSMRRRGLSVWFDETAVPDFGGITESVRQGLADSKALLVFYSSSYPLSSPCQWELTSAFLASARLGDSRRRVLVVNPEPGPGHIEPVELRDALYLSASRQDHEQIDAIANAIASHVERLHGELGAGIISPALWLPAKPSLATRFVGRWREMWRIHSALHAPEAATTQGAFGQGAVQVRGLGGIGKSLLAREYALRFETRYPGGVFWLYAQGDLTVDSTRQERDALRLSQLRGFATSVLGAESAAGLGLLSPEDIEAVLRNAFARSEACLWVVDDLPAGLGAEEVYRWLGPAATTSTLITTRSGEYAALVPELVLNVLESDEAQEVLYARRTPADDKERAAAKAVVEELGGHALAVDVAGATLRFQSYSELLEHLLDPSEDELELAAELREELPTGKERSISSTLSRSLDRLDEEGLDLLRIASMLARDPIPRSLFSAIFEVSNGLRPAVAHSRTLRALDQAHSLSLIEPNEKDSWKIHPLLASTVQLKDTGTDRQELLRASAVAVLRERLGESSDPAALEAKRQVVGHARRLAQVLGTPEQIDLIGRVARYDFEVGDYGSAKAGYMRQVEASAQTVGRDDPVTLSAMSALARTFRAFGETHAARTLGTELLEVSRDVLGPHHPDRLSVTAELAMTLLVLGDLRAARELSEQALAGRSEVLGPHHPDTVSSMNDLMGVLWAQGELHDARALEEEVLSIRREVLGPHHPDTLDTMGNLAVPLWALGEMRAARALEEEVLAVRREVLGPHHPQTLETMGNLAITIRDLGELRAALELEEEVLAARLELLGPRHPLTFLATANLGVTRRELGELQAARELLEDALVARRELFESNHPELLRTMANLAITMREMGDLQEARELEDEVLAARRKLLGPHHTDTMLAMHQLAVTLRVSGEVEAAKSLTEEVLVARREHLGAHHPQTLATVNELAVILRESGDLQPSRAMLEEVLTARREIFDPPHPDTFVTMYELAVTLRELRDLQESRALLEEVVTGRRAILGPEHHKTVAAMDELARTLAELDNPDPSAPFERTIRPKGDLQDESP